MKRHGVKRLGTVVVSGGAVVALAIGIITILNVLGFVGIIAFVAAAVYLADVRPALRQVTGRGGSRKNQGPYGPW